MERIASPGTEKHLRSRLEARTSPFEKAWAAAAGADHAPDLHRFVPPADDAERLEILRELIAIDLRHRWQHHQPIHLESYLNRYPELKNSDNLSAELVHAEYSARQLHGDKPSLSSYQERFPSQFAELQRLIVLEMSFSSGNLPATDVLDKYATVAPHPDQEPAKAPEGMPAWMTAAPSPLASTRRLRQEEVLPISGGYRLLRRLGRGSFGEVWHAQAPGGVEVAVKIISRPLDDETSKRELQSLELIKRLRHPYLLSTQAYWSLEDQLFIAMELADGSLSDRLKQCHKAGQPGIPPAELLAYFREAAEGLDFLHKENVQHRDIKPDNLLLLQNHIKVADFGLARLQESLHLTAATFCGTPAFMAPEVWAGKISPNSDQYSLAMTYALLRTGRMPFDSNNVPALMLRHLNDKPDLEGLPEAEQQVVLRAMAKDPTERYPDCQAFVRALGEALAPLPAADGAARDTLVHPSGVAATVRDLAPPRSRARLWVFLAFLPVALALGAGVGLVVRSPEPDRPESPATTANEVFLPPGYTKADDQVVRDRNGKAYYRRITHTLPGDPNPVELLAIPKEAGADPETFYIMKNKVSVGLFKAFADAKGVRVRDWNQDKDPRFPALGVAVDDACKFASECLGGKLPTTEQWDRAAGYSVDRSRLRGEGPYQGVWKPDSPLQIALTGPMPVGEAKDDESPTGCRDMAGNGFEWTRSLQGTRETLPLPDPERSVFVLLRGKGFSPRFPEPFTYEDLTEGRIANRPSREKKVEQDVGFRVVVEPEP